MSNHSGRSGDVAALLIVALLGLTALPALMWRVESAAGSGRAATQQTAKASAPATLGNGGQPGPTGAASQAREASLDAAATGRSLQTELQEYLSDQSGTYGLAVRDLESGQTVLVNADRPFLAASTYKLLVMYRVYQQMASGALKPDDALTITLDDLREEPDQGLQPGQRLTVAEALDAMITVSDNAAAYALIRTIGGWSAVESAARELGMTRTGLRDQYFWTTPADMLKFLQALVDGTLVSPDASKRMVQLLQRQQINDRLPALLPDGAVVAHKTGELEGVRNDVGIVYGPSGQYLICAFSDSVDPGDASGVIAEVSRRVYDRYGE